MKRSMQISALTLANIFVADHLIAQTALFPLTYTGTIGVAAIEDNGRHPEHPAMLVLTLLDAQGNRIKFCNHASLPWNVAIATTDAQFAAVQQIVTQVQSAKMKITLVAAEDTADSDGLYCGIQSITVS